MITLILFIFLLSLIIVVHEGGHLLAAKFFNVYCSEFSLGMGPKIFSKKFKETEYSLRALPLGGFVAMAGDNDNALETSTDTSEIPYERTLNGIAKWKKIIILLAGIFMNFVLGYVIICILLLNSGVYASSASSTISEVIDGYPAQQAGMLAGDTITAIEIEGVSKIEVSNFDGLAYYIDANTEGKDMIFTVERNGETLQLNVTPLYDEESQSYKVGISSSYNYEEVTLGNVFGFAWDQIVSLVSLIFLSLGQLLKGVGIESVSGPVGIYSATGQAASLGVSSYFYMIALISINIGIMNLLPLPILDGGRVLLTLIEAIIRRPLSQKVEAALMSISMLLILALFVFATFNDVLRLF